MAHIETLGRKFSRLAIPMLVFVGSFALILAMIKLGPAEVLRDAADQGKSKDFGSLVNTADELTRKALVPTIAVAPLAAVAGGFAMMVGGGGRGGSGGVKLIGGAIGAVVIVVAARGLAA